MSLDLTEQIYEAAFVPDRWPGVLADIGARAGSASGALQIIRGSDPPLWTATDNLRDTLQTFIAAGLWRTCERPVAVSLLKYSGFVCSTDYLTAEQLEGDVAGKMLQELGLGWQLATVVPMPSGEVVALTFERRLGQGRHDPQSVAVLDALRPHLARAALLAARLGLERAQTAVATLEAIGLPAAVLTGAGRVLVANESLETLSPELLKLAAFGRLAIADLAADVLWRGAVSDARAGREPIVRSIPVAATEKHAAAVVHLLPLRGAACDIFSGAALLVVVTRVGLAERVADRTLLHGLFDLTPAEARLAAALSAGHSLKQAGESAGLQFSTARSYLEQIFRKTGTHQQSQLVALLKSAQPLGKAP